MRKLTTAGISAVMLGLLAVQPLAYANHDDDDHDDDDGYASTAYADVVSARPLTRVVEVSTPRQECWQEEVHYPAREHVGITGQTVIGGLLGAAVGNRIGSGRGRDAATVAGGLIGASIGANRAQRQAEDSHERIAYEKRCRTVTERHTEERIDGYDVTYRYGGQTYHTRLPYDPGRRLKVNVAVSPAEG